MKFLDAAGWVAGVFAVVSLAQYYQQGDESGGQSWDVGHRVCHIVWKRAGTRPAPTKRKRGLVQGFCEGQGDGWVGVAGLTGVQRYLLGQGPALCYWCCVGDVGGYGCGFLAVG